MSATHESGLPKGVSGESEEPIPERVVRWELTPDEIEQMDPEELKHHVADQQLMIARLQEAIELLRKAAQTNSPVTKSDFDIVYSPEKREEYEHLRKREMD